MAITDSTLKIELVTEADLSGITDLQNALAQMNGTAVAGAQAIGTAAAATGQAVANAASTARNLGAAAGGQATDWRRLTEFAEQLEHHMINHVTHMRALGGLVRDTGAGWGALITIAALAAEIIFKIHDAQAAFKEEVAKTNDQVTKTITALQDVAAAARTEGDLAAIAKTVTTQQRDLNAQLDVLQRKADNVDVLQKGFVKLLNAVQSVTVGIDAQGKRFVTTATAEAVALEAAIDNQARLQAVTIQNAEASVRWAESLSPTQATLDFLQRGIDELRRQIDALDKNLPGFAEKWANLRTTLSDLVNVFNMVTDAMKRANEQVKAQEDLRTRLINEWRLANVLGNQELTTAEKVKQAREAAVKAAKDQHLSDEAAAALGEIAAETAKKNADYANQQKTAHKELTDVLRQESLIIQQIRANQELISKAPFLGADEKQAALMRLYAAEVTQVVNEIERLRREKATLIDPAQIDQVNSKLLDLRKRLAEIRLEMLAGQHSIAASLQAWANSFGKTSEQIAQTIEGTIGAALEGLNQWIVTGKFNLQSMMQQIELLGLKLVEQLIIQRVMAAINAKAAAAEAAILGPTIAGEMAGAATAMTIATHGEAAIAAPGEVAAALFSIQALLFGGKAHEGMEVGGPLASDERLIVAQTGEIVINRDVAREHRDFLLRLNATRPASTSHLGLRDLIAARAGWLGGHHGGRGSIGGASIGGSPPGTFYGGFFGSGGGGGPGHVFFLRHAGGEIGRYHNGGSVGGAALMGGVHVYAFTDMSALTKHMASRQGQKIIFDTVRGNRIDLGMR